MNSINTTATQAAPGPRGSSLAAPPIARSKFIDTLDLPFPKTLAELQALDATREIPYLKALCNRRFIGTPAANPTPQQIIPIIEQVVANHRAKKPQTLSPYADIFVEWKLILEDLEEFLTNLRSLLPLPSTEPKMVGRVAPRAPRADHPVTNVEQGGAYQNPTEKPSSTPRHSNNPNQKPTETPVIQTNPSSSSQTFGHSNNLPHKNSSAPQNQTPHESQTQPTPTTRPRRNHPVLANLTHDQKQQLVDLCQTRRYRDAAQHAREKLGIQISVGTLSNLCTTWQIRDDEDTRNQIQSDNNATIEALTEKQLQLRLLELASRPNMDHAELRAITHSFARLQSVKLSERRVAVAEEREARMNTTQQPHTPQIVSQEEMTHYVKTLLGKEITLGDEPSNHPCTNRRQEILTTSESLTHPSLPLGGPLADSPTPPTTVAPFPGSATINPNVAA